MQDTGVLIKRYEELEELVSQTLDIEDGGKYRIMLNALKTDVLDREDAVSYLGFLRAPAAAGNHHAEEGGLVRHLLEMWYLYQDLRGRLEGHKVPTPEMSPRRVLKGIINHDLHKAYKTYVLKSYSPWEVKYGNHITDRMLTMTGKSEWVLHEHQIYPDMEDQHALAWAEGGWADHD